MPSPVITSRLTRISQEIPPQLTAAQENALLQMIVGGQ